MYKWPKQVTTVQWNTGSYFARRPSCGMIISNYYMACVWSRFNGHSAWLSLGHYSPVIPTGRLRASKTKTKSHIINNLLNSNNRSSRENLKPQPSRSYWPCYHSASTARCLRFCAIRQFTLGKEVVIMLRPFELRKRHTVVTWQSICRFLIACHNLICVIFNLFTN